MRNKSLAGIMVLVSLAAGRTALAWNATGHEVVAFVAWSQLTPEAKAKVIAILKEMPDKDYTKTLTHDRQAGEVDEQAFAVAATWPDLIRSANFGPNNKYHRPGWHYLDIPYALGGVKTPAPEEVAWKPGVEPGNAVQAILKNKADLENPATTPPERAVALCWIEHLVGDIHQPLHAVSEFSETYPEGDKGGNSQSVKNSGRVTNLHSLWDGMLGEYMPIVDVKAIAMKWEGIYPPASLEKEAAVKDPMAWAQESYDIAKRVVYQDGKLVTGRGRGKSAPDLPAGYVDAAKPVAGRQAVLGGYRLAAVLNSILDPKQP